MTNWEDCYVVDSVADIEFIGISLAAPTGTATYYRDEDGVLVKEVGDLLDPRDGRLLVFPRKGITLDDRGFLLGIACNAYTEKRSGPVWHTYIHKGKRRHSCTVVVRADVQHDRTASAIVALEDPRLRYERAKAEREAQANELLPLDSEAIA